MITLPTDASLSMRSRERRHPVPVSRFQFLSEQPGNALTQKQLDQAKRSIVALQSDAVSMLASCNVIQTLRDLLPMSYSSSG